MRIASSTLEMHATHQADSRHEVSESLRLWVGPPPEVAPPRGDAVTISDAARLARSNEAAEIEQRSDETENDPRMLLLRALIRMLTGEEARVVEASDLEAEPPAAAPATPTEAPSASPKRPAGYGVDYQYHESYHESEQTTFSADGTIRTTDGTEITFHVELAMARSYRREMDVRLLAGDALRQKKDPLVLNFGGNAVQLGSQRFNFDLDADGQSERINLLASGSGFLALDRNGDGRIVDGSELFGTRSGDGFADLAALDQDGNGWIDEGDAAFDQLLIWRPDTLGQGSTQTLREAGIGALALNRLQTPFELKDADNIARGNVRGSGIFLQEDGHAGTMQQIDLTV